MSTWEDLVGAALLGTDHHGGDRAAQAGAVALLDAAAVAVPRRWAGRGVEVIARPAAGTTSGSAAQEETLPAVPPAAEARLVSLYASTGSELLVRWLDLVHQVGKRVPARELPRLLEGARFDGDVRAALAPVLGERGRWLAGQRARWSEVLAHPATLHADVDLEQVWEHGSPPERRAALVRSRGSDPHAGRTMLTRTWEVERAPEREAFVRAMATGLDDADEDLLVRALHDRGAAVRTAAAEVLSLLPGSALGRRAAARAGSAVHLEVRGQNPPLLVVTPPHDLDASMEADMIGREPPYPHTPRAWWLLQIVAAVPLEHWTDLAGTDPAGVLALATTPEWDLALVLGWEVAAHRQHDGAWAEALLRSRRILAAHQKTADVLDASTCRALVAEVYRQCSDLTSTAAGCVVRACPRPWGPDVSAAVVTWFCDPEPGSREGGRLDAFQHLVPYCAALDLPLDALPAVRAATAAYPVGGVWRPAMDAAVSLLTTRATMLEELA